MSLLTTLQTGFKNAGHYFAVGAKYVAVGVKDMVLVANKAQVVEPEVDALVAAFAGPQAAAMADLSFHALGSIAAALQPVGTDVASLTSAQQKLSASGIQLDIQTLQDIKAAALQIENVFKAIGAKKPTV